ncbi:type 1 periplasmic binding fold superfamily protein [Lewinella sp. W8]|uniref:type 1 periplasmic binding fold superfamily protein n=1 Tax=Lewinella sp. W8 TaxID=2528208 RepID=UPI0010687014|nr:type 1 periplasmic binding fold superfamily protein [Lewinella sp. W8]MTB49788.1 type 1 periplasmic binding fold superfamily protein [Lewinella sp. W8]
MKNLFLLLFALVALVTFNACDDDDPIIENPEEVITDLTYTLTPTGGGDVVTMTFQDRDGDGGNAPTITVSGPLAANATYTGSLELLDASDASDIEDITEEVEEEDDEHMFFFQVSSADLTIAYGDSDGDGNPVGLLTDVTAGAAGFGTLTIILRHEPNKSAAGLAINTPELAGGETDIEVTFNVTIQ